MIPWRWAGYRLLELLPRDRFSSADDLKESERNRRHEIRQNPAVFSSSAGWLSWLLASCVG